MPAVHLEKMSTTVDPLGNVTYHLSADGEDLNMNELLGRKVSLTFAGKIRCIGCGRVTKKSFGQGYCYPCFTTSPHTEECVLRPHLCQAHLGVARDMAYAESHCLIDHYVYLALSGGLKVGVTRSTQLPTRWVDQGASEGLVVAQTPNRYLAGAIEVELMKSFSDKTNWRAMLTNTIPDIDLTEQRNVAHALLADDFSPYLVTDRTPLNLIYPVLAYPSKIVSFNLDKTPEVEGRLVGIRGQYLIFEGGRVINLRTFTGYDVEIRYE